MKIPSVSKFTNYIKSKVRGVKSSLSVQNRHAAVAAFKPVMHVDTFRRQTYSQKILSQLLNDNASFLCRRILSSVDEITPSVFNKFSKDEISVIRSQIPSEMAHHAEITVGVSRVLKNYFDKNLKKGNYVFVSVGRSFASVAQCLKFMGIEARYLPLSDLSTYEDSVAERMVQSFGFPAYKEYLYELFGTPEALKKNKKYFVVGDFCMSGTTLDVTKKILSHNTVGLSSKKIKYYNLNYLLQKIAAQRKTNPKDHALIDNFVLDAVLQNYDEYAPIRRLSWKNLGYIRFALESPKTELTKKFQFCLSDILSDESLII